MSFAPAIIVSKKCRTRLAIFNYTHVDDFGIEIEREILAANDPFLCRERVSSPRNTYYSLPKFGNTAFINVHVCT